MPKPTEPSFTLTWGHGTPKPVQLQGWRAAAAALRWQVTTLRNRMGGAGECFRILPNPETGNPDHATMRRNEPAQRGRPRTVLAGKLIEVTLAGQAPRNFEGLTDAAFYLGITAGSLRSYLTLARGVIDNNRYAVRLVPKAVAAELATSAKPLRKSGNKIPAAEGW